MNVEYVKETWRIEVVYTTERGAQIRRYVTLAFNPERPPTATQEMDIIAKEARLAASGIIRERETGY